MHVPVCRNCGQEVSVSRVNETQAKAVEAEIFARSVQKMHHHRINDLFKIESQYRSKARPLLEGRVMKHRFSVDLVREQV